jgi:hypothetical protein
MDRLTASLDYQRRQGPALIATIAPIKPARLVRDLARKAKSDIALHQRRAGMRRCHYVTVWETEPSCHPHIVATFSSAIERDKAVVSLNSAPSYLRHGPATMFAEAVTDWNGLAGYLLGEATQQAWYAANKAFRRVKGPHRLEGGGDRVIPSPDLKASLLRAGRIEPFRRTTASRALPKPSAAIVIEALPVPRSPPISAPVQLAMSFDVQPVPVLQLFDAKCRALG